MEEVHEMFEFLTQQEFTVGMLYDCLKSFKWNKTTTQLYDFIYEEHQRKLTCDKELDWVSSIDDEEINPPKKPRTVEEAAQAQAAPNDQSCSTLNGEVKIPETPHGNEVPEKPQSLKNHDSMEVNESIKAIEQQPTGSPGTSRSETNNPLPKAQKTKITDFFQKALSDSS